MHHRELEVRRRIVDRNSRVFGDRDHDQPDQRHRERHPQAHVGALHEGRHRRELRRAGEQRQREGDHQHRRLGQRGDHHLPARADPAEARAHVEPGQREHEARAAEQRDDGDQVGGRTEHEAGGKRRHERRRHPGRGEDHVRRDAKDPRGVVREHDFLAQQLEQVAIGLDDRGPLRDAAGAP